MTNVGVASYLAGGVMFLFLSLLLITSWKGRPQGGPLVAASVASAIWGFVLAYDAFARTTPSVIIIFVEFLRSAIWLIFLVRLLACNGSVKVPALLTRAVYALLLVALLLVTGFYVSGLASQNIAQLSAAFIAIGLLFSITGLVLVEQLYKNTRSEQRWAIKFLCFGLGGVFVYDLFLYSQGLLFRSINLMLWDARGAVNALIVPFIAVAIARNPRWSGEIFVSRQIIFSATSFIGIGLYLLAMAIGGFYIRLYGGNWGTFAQVIFLVGAALILLTILASGQVRARLKVFLSRHFYTSKYDYREEWSRLISMLSASKNAATLHERTIMAMAQIVESPGGMLWLQSDDGYQPVGTWNMPFLPDARVNSSSEIVQILNERMWVVDLEEYHRNPELYPPLELPEWLVSLPRAWLVVPLIAGQALFGFILLAKSRAPFNLTWEDRDLLKMVGQEVAGRLGQHKADQSLAEAQQFDAFNRLSAFIMHDIKNLILQLSLVVKNAVKHKTNPAFIATMIDTVENSVSRMRRLMEQLQQGESKDFARRVNLTEVLEKIASRHADRTPHPQLEVRKNLKSEVLIDPDSLFTALGHLIRNAQDAAANDGHIIVRLAQDGVHAVIEIEDDGCGMDPDFVRDRLFRPFDSTKGSKGMGIGACQVRDFVKAAGGKMYVESEPGKGTLFGIALPLLVESNAACNEGQVKGD